MTKHKNRQRFGPDYQERDLGYDTPCWIWLKGLKDGKPVKYLGVGTRMSGAKFYWEGHGHPSLRKSEILYKLCREKLCVNPKHMEPMTAKQAGRLIQGRSKATNKMLDRDAPMQTYFIQMGEGGPIKIGQSRDVASRLHQLDTYAPYPLKVLATSPEPGAERICHSTFNHLKTKGEWFEPNQELLDYISRLT